MSLWKCRLGSSAALVLILSLTGCGGGGSGSSGTAGSISGKGTDVTGVPVPNVEVVAGGVTATTDEAGNYVLDAVPSKNDMSINAKLLGFMPYSTQVALAPAGTSLVNISMIPILNTGNYASTTGGVYNGSDGSSITLPANAYVVAGTKTKYEGNITIATQDYNVGTTVGALTFPNSYRTNDGLIHSHGGLEIILVGEQGESLQLDGNSKVIIEMAGLGVPSEGQKMEVWHYNNTNGRWSSEGDAEVKGSRYRAVVSKVGLLTLGSRAAGTAKVTGCVVNENQEVVQHSKIQLLGNNWLAQDFDTDSEGRFSVTAIADTPFEVSAGKGGNATRLPSPFVAVPDSTLDIPECIVLTSPSAQFTLVWGAEPRDLDAHLVFARAADEVSQDVSFGNPNVGDITLSADAATGIGPEVIDIGKLTDGTYTFSVQHFNGLSRIANSGATATLDITGQVTRTLIAPEVGGTGVDDEWTIWTVTVKSGNITIKDVNTIAKKKSLKTEGFIDISVKGVQ